MKHQIGEKIRITYGKPPQRIWVRIISTIAGGDLVAIDREGRFYTTSRETNAEKAKKLQVTQRHWRRYSSGIYYLHRGLMQALVTTREIKLPTLEELRAFCLDKQAELTVFSGKVDLPRLEAMSGKFAKLGEFLENKIRWPLTESRDQLSYFLIFRDSLGRVNIGMLRARLSTIDRRFSTELEHLLGWLPHYAARLEAVSNLQNELQRQVLGIA